MRHSKLIVALLGLSVACGTPEPTDNGRTDAGNTPAADAGTHEDAGISEDAGSVADAGVSEDAGARADAGAQEDAGTPSGEINPAAAEALAAARAAEPGAMNELVDGAIVTAVRPTIGNDRGGFFVQATQTGPALFIADEASAEVVNAGDIVRFTISGTGDSAGQRIATAIDGLEVLGQGDHSTMLQDVNAATDLVDNLDGYEAEYLTANLRVTGEMGYAGQGYLAASVDTAGMVDSELKLRVPEALVGEMGMVPGCTLTFTGPMWRYRVAPQLSAYQREHFTALECPATSVVTAQATGGDSVVVHFSRALRADSLEANGSQFTIAGLEVSAAVLADEDSVTLTTSAQGRETYTVVVGETLLDAAGRAISREANSAQFEGFAAGVQLRITEINANISRSCDLVELRAIGAGNLEGFTFSERGSAIYTFPAMTVADGDFIVLHLDNSDCNGSGATDETQAKNEQPNAQHGANFDSAWDVWSNDSGLTATDNVFAVHNGNGIMVDAVLVANAPEGTAASGSERAAVAVVDAQQWTNPDGNVPGGGYIDDVFRANAVQGLSATADDGSTSLQRIPGQDNNHRGDWRAEPAPANWGAANGDR